MYHVRRIQERVTDPLASVELIETPEGGENNPELEQLLNQTNPGGTPGGDGSANPLNFESGQLNEPGPIIGSGGEPLPVPLSGLEREYVWGPGDNGLDEILVQYDLERKAFWMIQDGGGDVVAMCDLAGSGGTARVVKSWQYDAYGQCLRATDVVAATSSYSIPMNRIGHKGLFMDRLDVSAANPGTYADNVRLAPFSTVLYQNRNRTYSPQLGRFIQRDPNQSGQLLAAMQGYGGEITPFNARPFGLTSLYNDGGSLHCYTSSSPTNGSDPMGLDAAMANATGLLMVQALGKSGEGTQGGLAAFLFKSMAYASPSIAPSAMTMGGTAGLLAIPTVGSYTAGGVAISAMTIGLIGELSGAASASELAQDVASAALRKHPKLPVIPFSRSIFPGICENIEHAMASGRPAMLTYNGGKEVASKSRLKAVKGCPTARMRSRDEYPFATTVEGGSKHM